MSNVPGFTAHASFHGASERYGGVATASTNVQNRAVIPQVCFTVPLCIPVLHKKVRVCYGLFSGFSYSLVNC